MERVVIAVVLGSLVLVRAAAAQSATPEAPASSVESGSGATHLADVPPLPRGKSTIMGGKIDRVDQVRDQFVLHVYGEKPIKIWYDERTQFFKDGNKVSLLELGPTDHASVQTMLDGSRVFAVTVHILSANPTGDFEGRILDYDSASGWLTLLGPASRGKFRVRVTNATKVSRQGQAAFTSENQGQSDLKPGALVSLNFQPDSKGQGIAQTVTILATPGATFLFTGAVSDLNIARGYLVIMDPADQQTHQIHFDPKDPAVENLHPGDHVRIEAVYDGTQYAATQITPP